METKTMTPVETVVTLLTNLSNAEVIASLVADDAIYVSLNQDNPELKKIMPWCGTNKGVSAFVNNLAMVQQCWETLDFKPTDVFGADERVALFGTFRYRSRELHQIVESPFSILAKVKDGKITYLQFMEDTFATAGSFRVGKAGTFRNFPGASPITI